MTRKTIEKNNKNGNILIAGFNSDIIKSGKNSNIHVLKNIESNKDITIMDDIEPFYCDNGDIPFIGPDGNLYCGNEFGGADDYLDDGYSGDRTSASYDKSKVRIYGLFNSIDTVNKTGFGIIATAEVIRYSVYQSSDGSDKRYIFGEKDQNFEGKKFILNLNKIADDSPIGYAEVTIQLPVDYTKGLIVKLGNSVDGQITTFTHSEIFGVYLIFKIRLTDYTGFYEYQTKDAFGNTQTYTGYAINLKSNDYSFYT